MVAQFITTLFTYPKAAKFIKENKLWHGFWQYRWVLFILMFLAMIVSIKILNIMYHGWHELTKPDSTSTFVHFKAAASTIYQEGYSFLFNGSLKYFIMILLEVVVFHMVRRTNELLSGVSLTFTFNEFLSAQIRMIKVTIRCFILEMIATLFLKIFFGIFGFIDYLEPIAIFVAQSYYLGMLMLDSYNESKHMSIKESFLEGKKYTGMILALGFVLNLILMVPLLGAMVGPALAAVTLTMVMFYHLDKRAIQNA
ncbi:MAG: hypothetical protein KDC49_08525 [Saprospiraceae bacterium]|nr:hypothetical protein [Saprospiraceae bacterium]